MTDGPDWAETFGAIKNPSGLSAKSSRPGMDQVAQWQEFQQQRTGADVAVAVGGVDTGDDYDGWGFLADWGGNIRDSLTGIWNGWFGTGGDGSAPQVIYTIETIKDAVLNGYQVHAFTSSEVGWAVPAHTEFHALLMSGGQPGGGGGSGGNGTPGGTGGLDGSYLAQVLDLTGVTALDVAVATAGNRSYVRVANVTPHTGTQLAISPPHGAPGSIATTFGYAPSTSAPGKGGTGGAVNGTVSTNGGSSAIAAGGVGGGWNGFGVGLPGGDGGSVSAGASTKCGGGGGGGGGGSHGVFQGGGAGGNGGYPGGGGGGGGAGAFPAPGGGGGAGAPGVVWGYWK